MQARNPGSNPLIIFPNFFPNPKLKRSVAHPLGPYNLSTFHFYM